MLLRQQVEEAMEEMPLSCQGMCGPKVHLVEDGTYSKDSKASLHISKVQGSRPAIHEVLTPVLSRFACKNSLQTIHALSKERLLNGLYLWWCFFGTSWWHLLSSFPCIQPCPQRSCKVHIDDEWVGSTQAYWSSRCCKALENHRKSTIPLGLDLPIIKPFFLIWLPLWLASMFEIPNSKTSQLPQLCVKEHSVQSGSGGSYHVGLWDHIEILNTPRLSKIERFLITTWRKQSTMNITPRAVEVSWIWNWIVRASTVAVAGFARLILLCRAPKELDGSWVS